MIKKSFFSGQNNTGRRLLSALVAAGLALTLSAGSVFAADSYASMSGVGSTRYHKYSASDYIIIDGIDVSVYQSLSADDWVKLKKAGVDFAFVRTSGSFTGRDQLTMYDDFKFEDNFDNARDAGMMLGTYHYTSAISTAEAKKEAKKSLEMLDGRELDLPIVFDSECNIDRCSNLRYHGEKRIKFALAFDSYIRSHSENTTMYYSYLNMMNNEPGFKKNVAQLEEAMPIWIAQYNNTCDYSGNYSFWQHSSTGYFCNGTIGPLDCNFWYFKRDSQMINTSTEKACTVKSLATYKYYKGYALKPKVKVTDGSKVLQEGTDYKVNYVKNVKVGTGYAIVTGLGDYSGQAAAPFKIYKQSIKTAVIDGFDESYDYTGSAVTPEPKITLGGKTLVKGTHYTLSYSDNTDVGTATVTVTGTGIYKGKVSSTFTIKESPLDPERFTVKDGAYTGKPVEGKIQTDYQDKDYSVTYQHNVELGTATAVITGNGNCTGQITKEFAIYLPAPSSVTPELYGMKDIRVSWKKVTGADKYMVYYKSAKMTSYKKLSETGETTLELPDCHEDTKYSFKVIPYKTSKNSSIKGKTRIKSIYTLGKVSKPEIEKSGSLLEISWKEIKGADGYEISKSTSRYKTKVVYDFQGASECTRKISAKKNTTFYYKVRAYKEYDGQRIYATWSPVRIFMRY